MHAPEIVMHRMEAVNRRAWRNPLAQWFYRKSSGVVNEGEAVVLARAAAMLQSPRVLDIGVGGGRTTGLLLEFAGSYVGIDYTPELLRHARKRFPGERFEQMDARQLTFPDRSFDLAFFSFNGIDSVDGPGRKRVLAEVSRVLSRDGLFAFSTFYRNWEGFRDTSAHEGINWSANPLRLAIRLARHQVSRRRARKFAAYENHGEDAVFRHSAHDYGILIYATTPAQAQDQLRAAGFGGDILFFDTDGALLAEPVPESLEHFFVLAQK